MLSKKWLNDKLYVRVGTIYGLEDMNEDIEAIAQAAEEDKAKLKHCYQQAHQMDKDIAGMAVVDMKAATSRADELEAKVAVMSEALRLVQQYMYLDGLYHERRLGLRMSGRYVSGQERDNVRAKTVDAIEQALSAAPKVVFSIDLESQDVYDMFAEGEPEIGKKYKALFVEVSNVYSK
jgi:hypothetical protein